jgi:GLPGLI family protein
MKKAKIIITGIALTVSVLQLNAQKKITEGTIKYDIQVETNNKTPQMADMYDGATTTVYLKGGLTRSEIVSSLGTQSTIIDRKAGKGAIVKQYGDKKYIITMTSQNWKDANKKYDNITFTYFDEYKTIAGYKCQKAIGVLNDDTAKTNYVVYFTKELVSDNNDYEYRFKTLPGIAMEYETAIGSLKVKYTVSAIDFNIVPASTFDLPKSGYRVLTYEESKGGK